MPERHAQDVYHDISNCVENASARRLMPFSRISIRLNAATRHDEPDIDVAHYLFYSVCHLVNILPRQL